MDDPEMSFHTTAGDVIDSSLRMKVPFTKSALRRRREVSPLVILLTFSDSSVLENDLYKLAL